MGETILVVDDESDLLFALRLALEVEGYRVLQAGSGEEGLEIIDSEQIDALILDLRLPGIDGWGVIEALKARQLFPGLPVIVASAHASGEARAKANQLGVSAYLMKPFSAETLRRTLKNALAS